MFFSKIECDGVFWFLFIKSCYLIFFDSDIVLRVKDLLIDNLYRYINILRKIFFFV